MKDSLSATHWHWSSKMRQTMGHSLSPSHSGSHSVVGGQWALWLQPPQVANLQESFISWAGVTLLEVVWVSQSLLVLCWCDGCKALFLWHLLKVFLRLNWCESVRPGLPGSVTSSECLILSVTDTFTTLYTALLYSLIYFWS